MSDDRSEIRPAPRDAPASKRARSASDLIQEAIPIEVDSRAAPPASGRAAAAAAAAAGGSRTPFPSATSRHHPGHAIPSTDDEDSEILDGRRTLRQHKQAAADVLVSRRSIRVERSIGGGGEPSMQTGYGGGGGGGDGYYGGGGGGSYGDSGGGGSGYVGGDCIGPSMTYTGHGHIPPSAATSDPDYPNDSISVGGSFIYGYNDLEPRFHNGGDGFLVIIIRDFDPTGTCQLQHDIAAVWPFKDGAGATVAEIGPANAIGTLVNFDVTTA